MSALPITASQCTSEQAIPTGFDNETRQAMTPFTAPSTSTRATVTLAHTPPQPVPVSKVAFDAQGVVPSIEHLASSNLASAFTADEFDAAVRAFAALYESHGDPFGILPDDQRAVIVLMGRYAQALVEADASDLLPRRLPTVSVASTVWLLERWSPLGMQVSPHASEEEAYSYLASLVRKPERESGGEAGPEAHRRCIDTYYGIDRDARSGEGYSVTPHTMRAPQLAPTGSPGHHVDAPAAGDAETETLVLNRAIAGRAAADLYAALLRTDAHPSVANRHQSARSTLLALPPALGLMALSSHSQQEPSPLVPPALVAPVMAVLRLLSPAVFGGGEMNESREGMVLIDSAPREELRLI